MAAGLPLVLCASKLNLDLWHDEIFTIEAFVSDGVASIVTDYSAPNNHVLYSLLLRPFYLLSDSTFVLRWPSLLASLGTLWMVFRLACRLSGLAAGMLAVFWLGLTQMFLIHTMQIRGFGLSMFLAAWLAELTLASKPSRRRWAAIVLVGAAFVYVMPTNVLFLAPLAAVAVAWTGLGRPVEAHDPGSVTPDASNRPGVRSAQGRTTARLRPAMAEAAAWMGSGVLAAALYAPIAGQVLAESRKASPGSWASLTSLYGRVAGSALCDFWPLLAPVAAGLAIWGVRFARRPWRRELGVPLLAGGVWIGSLVLSSVLGTSPFERNLCPLLPALALAAGWLLAELVDTLRRRWVQAWPPPMAALAAMLLIGAVVLPRLWTYPERLEQVRRREFAQGGYFNYYAANYHPADVVDYLQQSVAADPAYQICFAHADHLNLVYYLHRAGLPLTKPAQAADRSQVPVVYVIAAELADFEAIVKDCGLQEDAIRVRTLVRDFGYYRLFRCNGLPSAAVE